MTEANHDVSEAEVTETGARKPTSRSGASQPISQHPLFPAIVALWVGALFGAGSLVIRPALLERLVSLTHIDAVLPFAAAPLGSTARILVALALTGLGALIGLIVARRIASPAPVHHSSRRAALDTAADDDTAEHPAEASVAVETPEATPAPAERTVMAGRRRSFIAQTEEAPQAASPVAPQILDVADFDVASFDEPTDLPMAEKTNIRTAQGSFAAPADLTGAPEAEVLGGRLFAEYTRPASNQAASNQNDAHDETDLDTPAKPGFALLGAVEPMEDAPASDPAWFAHEIQSVDTAEQDAPASADQPSTDHPSPDQPSADSDAERRSAREQIAAASLDDLSPVQLLERLAIAIEQRRSAASLHSPAPPLTSDEPEAPVSTLAAEDESTAPAQLSAPQAEMSASPGPFVPLHSVPLHRDEPSAETNADRSGPALNLASFPAAAQIPTGLRPISLDPAEDDHEQALPGYVPPRHIGLATAPLWQPAGPATAEQAEPTEAKDSDDTLDEGYSSLLNLSRQVPPRPQFVRVDDAQDAEHAENAGAISQTDPAAQPRLEARLSASATDAGAAPTLSPPRLFDAPTRPGTVDTERALRDALATLQRMSGAA